MKQNPYKKLKCNYVYDYCRTESCNCKKSSEWERKHNPYHDWVNYKIIKPPIGLEVLAQNDIWINEDYNKKGIRIGFQNESDEGYFISAKYSNTKDCYETIDNSNPTIWKIIN